MRWSAILRRSWWNMQAGMREIELTQGKVALVSDKDYARVIAYGKWYAVKGRGDVWYAARNESRQYCVSRYRRRIFLHRFVLNINDDKIEVDHKNLNGLDNQRRNLRIASRNENMHNRKKCANNTSGYKGVHLHMGRVWLTHIKINGKTKHIGVYKSLIKAAQAYDVAAVKYYGKFACLNFSREA